MELSKHTQNIHEVVTGIFHKAADSAHLPSFMNEFSKTKNFANRTGIPSLVEGLHFLGEKHGKGSQKFDIFENAVVDIRETPLFNRFFSLFPSESNELSRPGFYPVPFSSPSPPFASAPIDIPQNKNKGKKALMEDSLSSSIEELLSMANVACYDAAPGNEDSLQNSMELDKDGRRKSAGPLDLNLNNEQQENQMCRYYKNGFCLRGEFCNFAHGDDGARTNLTSASQFGTLDDCTGQLYLMCLDQFGCRFLQKELDANVRDVTDKIFYEIIDYIVELMSDPFGNYLCQKLLELCDDNQRFMILDAVSSSLVEIATNIHGTRAVQKLIEVANSEIEFNIIRESFKDHVVSMIQDLNGNHVVQKCLQKMIPNENNQFIYDSVAAHCIEVTTHRHGCCVFQRCIDHGTYNQKLQLVDTVKWNAVTLIKDPFGNYAVQYIIELKYPNIPGELIKSFQGQIYYLAKQKFSSNVIEKCLKEGDSVCVKRVMSELLFDTNSVMNETSALSRSFLKKKAQEQLFDLLQDCFGNYVVQTCLSEGITKANREYLLMVELLVPYSHQLRNVPYGKKILCHLGFVENNNSNNNTNINNNIQKIIPGETGPQPRNHIWTPTKLASSEIRMNNERSNPSLVHTKSNVNFFKKTI